LGVLAACDALNTSKERSAPQANVLQAVTGRYMICGTEGWGDGELRSDMIAMERFSVPVHGCNDADELGEPVHVVGSAPRRKHVLGKVTGVDR
jgi:hypothetical protein